MIPFATTTITIYRRDDEQMYGEPYAGLKYSDRGVVVAEGVRAVIDVAVGRQAGIERNRGGESVRSELRLVADPCDLKHTDQVMDSLTGIVYDLSFLVWFPGLGSGDDAGHWEAGVVTIEGQVT